MHASLPVDVVSAHGHADDADDVDDADVQFPGQSDMPGFELWDFANCLLPPQYQVHRESRPFTFRLPEPANMQADVAGKNDGNDLPLALACPVLGNQALDTAIGHHLGSMTYEQLRFTLDPNPLTQEQRIETRKSVVSRLQRLTILKIQWDMWADDEVLWHLQQVADVFHRTGAGVGYVIDPLQATGWFNMGDFYPFLPFDGFDPRNLRNLLADVADVPVQFLLTAIKFHSYWVPLICTKHGRHGSMTSMMNPMNVHTWTSWTWHARSQPNMEGLLSHLMTQLGCLSYQWIIYEPDFTD